MKVIDLLNKIANGEEVPKKIIFENQELKYDEYGQDYIIFKDGYLFHKLFGRENNSFLNDEIEIIEEEKKIPEKIDLAWQNSFDEQVQQDCIKMIIKNINEIIDVLEMLNDKIK